MWTGVPGAVSGAAGYSWVRMRAASCPDPSGGAAARFDVRRWQGRLEEGDSESCSCLAIGGSSNSGCRGAVL